MPERKVFKDYDESVVQDAFDDAEPSSWQDLVYYLDRNGLAAGRLSAGEIAHLAADAKQAMLDNVPFTHNVEQAFRVLRSHRNPGLVRQEEQRWMAKTEPKSQAEAGGKRRVA
jgi:hypothetical protein